MAPNNLSWLSICKASRLKTVANLIGINSTGTKSDLCARIRADLLTSKFRLPLNHQNGEAKTAAAVVGRKKHHDIISIDMGIRNLAYCHISVPHDWNKRSKINPTVEQWTRIAISQKATIAAEITDHPKQAKKEPFDPQTFAQHAHTLIANLLTHSPTQILIERQRFRSMGGSSVQEWTLRVNMFESMLYAVLQTYSALGLWHGSVSSVTPAKVNSFWLGKDLDLGGSDEAGLMMIMGKKKKEASKKSTRSKVLKIELVERWLREGGVEFMGEAKKVGRRYLDKRGRKRGGGEGEDIGKLDDLADCLLQGMAWIRWEENRVAIVENGLEAVEELEGALLATR